MCRHSAPKAVCYVDPHKLQWHGTCVSIASLLYDLYVISSQLCKICKANKNFFSISTIDGSPCYLSGFTGRAKWSKSWPQEYQLLKRIALEEVIDIEQFLSLAGQHEDNRAMGFVWRGPPMPIEQLPEQPIGNWHFLQICMYMCNILFSLIIYTGIKFYCTCHHFWLTFTAKYTTVTCHEK